MPQRCEYKFLLGENNAEGLKKIVSERVPPDSNGGGKPYIVSSLYFDDDHHRLYFASHDREIFRYKLRLRVYGEMQNDDSVSFFEIKSKLNGRSEKRRLSLPLSKNISLYTKGEIPQGLSPQDKRLAEDIISLISRERLKPSAVVSYERLAFAAPGEARLRITFDSKLRIRTDALDLRLGTHGEPIMQTGETVLELKSGENLPRWLTKLLEDNNLKNISYSKYGRTNFNNIKGESLCLTQLAEF